MHSLTIVGGDYSNNSEHLLTPALCKDEVSKNDAQCVYLMKNYMMFDSFRRNCCVFASNNEVNATQLNNITIGAICELVPEDTFLDK